MRKFFAQNLIALAEKLDKPLYAVGGFVRNYLIAEYISEDVDLASGITVEELIPYLTEVGFEIVAEYKRTGTVMFTDGINHYEYTAFRKEKYLGGEHTPSVTEFTEDIGEDALRRDFKCNAIYYDIKNGKIVDPLGGVKDVQNKVLDTVTFPEKVFSNDGLRLMRLARFAGELNFTPTEEVMRSAKKYACNIQAISPERIYAELVKILQSDEKYPFSNPQGHYTGLKILDETTVLDGIFPELTDGRDMVQRADFHKYDVLEHSLRSALYADKSVRLASLLHDVGKPFSFRRDGYYYHHFEEGEKIVERALKRLRADNDTIKKVKFLVKEHMVDLDCSMKENKVRKFIVKNKDMLNSLLLVKQADFRASLEKDGKAPTLIKWGRIIDKMQRDGTPFSLKELKITSLDLIEIGYSGAVLGKELNKLWEYAVINPQDNNRDFLLNMAKRT
ncbi:MAG: CCA tRNA nucleotidyltransferase [Clostridia bacterium]|nr:CCA tRNA nucleotidyltransferase [Clostridia bacterium]